MPGSHLLQGFKDARCARPRQIQAPSTQRVQVSCQVQPLPAYRTSLSDKSHASDSMHMLGSAMQGTLRVGGDDAITQACSPVRKHKFQLAHTPARSVAAQLGARQWGLRAFCARSHSELCALLRATSFVPHCCASCEPSSELCCDACDAALSATICSRASATVCSAWRASFLKSCTPFIRISGSHCPSLFLFREPPSMCAVGLAVCALLLTRALTRAGACLIPLLSSSRCNSYNGRGQLCRLAALPMHQCPKEGCQARLYAARLREQHNLAKGRVYCLALR